MWWVIGNYSNAKININQTAVVCQFAVLLCMLINIEGGCCKSLVCSFVFFLLKKPRIRPSVLKL